MLLALCEGRTVRIRKPLFYPLNYGDLHVSHDLTREIPLGNTGGNACLEASVQTKRRFCYQKRSYAPLRFKVFGVICNFVCSSGARYRTTTVSVLIRTAQTSEKRA